MAQLKRILVPTDFSPTSDIAFNYALDMAARYGATLHVLHVLEDLRYATMYPDGYFVELAALREQLSEEAGARLATAAAQCTAVQVVATTDVEVGRPDQVIVEQATSRGTDLIVMGTHGRSGFAHLMLGSVAERVLRTAPCPVLIVRDTSRTADIIAAEAVTRSQVGFQPA
jgi:nucleotide-binding universal stress UspA family protein